MIQLTKIEQEHHLNCPCCGHTRLLVNSVSINVPGGGYWLLDGDTIFGLHQQLVDAGLEKPIDVNAPNAWDFVKYDYELLIGKCPSCDEEYFVLEVHMIDDTVEVDPDFVETYIRQNKICPPPTNFIARLAEPNIEWLVHRHDTPKGVALAHVFGPFDLNGNSTNGLYGVSAYSSGDSILQKGREFVFRLWPELKQLARAVNQPPENQRAQEC